MQSVVFSSFAIKSQDNYRSCDVTTPSHQICWAGEVHTCRHVFGCRELNSLGGQDHHQNFMELNLLLLLSLLLLLLMMMMAVTCLLGDFITFVAHFPWKQVNVLSVYNVLKFVCVCICSYMRMCSCVIITY